MTDQLNYKVEEQTIDLDDHRSPLTSPGLLRTHRASVSIAAVARARRNTLDHTEVLMRSPDSSKPDLPLGLNPRDYESALEDDNTSLRENVFPPQNPARHPSLPTRLTRHPRRPSVRSKEGSPSPPPSSSAFGQQRFRRNTLHSPEAGTSNIPPHHALVFPDDEAEQDHRSIVSISTDTEAEQDVCYPQEEYPVEGPRIDFEELEEYRAETAAPVPAVSPGQGDVPADISGRPLQITSPIFKPADEAFAELEKVKRRPSTSASLDPSNTNPGSTNLPIFTFFSPRSHEIISAQTLGGLLHDGETFQTLFNANEGHTWWLDVVNATEEEVTVLCKAFSIHPLTREDITTQESRDKVEMFNHYYFVSFRSFDSKTDSLDYLEPIHWYAVVFRHGTMTHGIMTFSSQLTPHAKNVLKRVSKLKDYIRLTPDWIAYFLIDDIVDTFMPVIEEIDSEVDGIEDNVHTARDEDAQNVFTNIGKSHKNIMSILRLIRGKSDVIKGFAKRCNEEIEIAPDRDVGMYLSDILDHLISMKGSLDHLESSLSRIHANFLAQIGIDNINSGNKTNKMLGKVTLLATILVPMNVLTGLFGMNVAVPWKSSDSLDAWFGILGFIIGFAALCVILFRYLKLV